MPDQDQCDMVKIMGLLVNSRKFKSTHFEMSDNGLNMSFRKYPYQVKQRKLAYHHFGILIGLGSLVIEW
tara:strand:+ start:614 stop:820 length:207 start_codon:yes stop_codon:yes gene_type:complete